MYYNPLYLLSYSAPSTPDGILTINGNVVSVRLVIVPSSGSVILQKKQYDIGGDWQTVVTDSSPAVGDVLTDTVAYDIRYLYSIISARSVIIGNNGRHWVVYVATPASTVQQVSLPISAVGDVRKYRIYNITQQAVPVDLDGKLQLLRPYDIITVDVDINRTNLDILYGSRLIKYEQLN